MMGWKDVKICVIGDEINDLPMIDAFGDFTVNTARDEIKKRASKSRSCQQKIVLPTAGVTSMT